MLFIIEGIDLTLLINIFKGFNSTLPRPTPQVFPIFAGRGGPGQDLFFAGRGSRGLKNPTFEIQQVPIPLV